jgi:hypothetical protein
LDIFFFFQINNNEPIIIFIGFKKKKEEMQQKFTIKKANLTKPFQILKFHQKMDFVNLEKPITIREKNPEEDGINYSF